MRAARVANLEAVGFRMDDVYTVGHEYPGNPKLACIRELAPLAFVDDYLPYLEGVPAGTFRGLIDARPNNSPNRNPKLTAPDSRHRTLLDFAKWWVSSAR